MADRSRAGLFLFLRLQHNNLATYRNIVYHLFHFATLHHNFLSPAATGCGEWDLLGKTGKQQKVGLPTFYFLTETNIVSRSVKVLGYAFSKIQAFILYNL